MKLPFMGSIPKLCKKIIQSISHNHDLTYHFRRSNEYRDCEIIDVPVKHGSTSGAFGYQKNSPFVGIFNYYINQMREKGKFSQK